MPLMVEKTLLGDKIHAARTLRGMTLQRLDEASGVSYSSINAIERGHREPRFGTVDNLAKALSIDPMLLLNPTISVEELQRRMAES
jgi:transcriptional regulator with XRE-family HTH domain